MMYIKPRGPRGRRSGSGLGSFFAWATGGVGCLIMSLIALSTIPAWITHVVYCFQHEKWGFLVAGALAFPVAIVHGWGIWFGWWG